MTSRRAWALLVVVGALVVGLFIVVNSLKETKEPPTGVETVARDDSNQTLADPMVTPQGVPSELSADDIAASGLPSVGTETTSQLDLEALDWFELPMPDVLEDPTAPSEEAREAVKEAIIRGLKAKSLEEAVRYYEEYLRKYPLSPDAVSMMNRLGTTYARIGRFDDARKMLRSAIAFAGEDRYVNIININLAHVDTIEGNLQQAEARLRAVMAKPVPESLGDPYAVAPQLFASRYFLSEVLERQGRVDEAHELLKGTAGTAVSMSKSNPEVAWLPSYVWGAYQRRVNLILRTDQDPATARMLAEEFKQLVPEREGRMYYSRMMSGIALWEDREQRLSSGDD